MNSITKVLILGVALGLAAAAPAAGGSGSCGKGKIWDADQGKCIKKPRRPGSDSGK